MSVEQIDVIDAIGVDKKTGKVVLTISDHLEWGGEHLLLLQEKLNTYIGFIDGGGLLEAYPDSKDRRVAINVVCKYPPDISGKDFLNNVGLIMEQLRVDFILKVSSLN